MNKFPSGCAEYFGVFDVNNANIRGLLSVLDDIPDIRLAAKVFLCDNANIGDYVWIKLICLDGIIPYRDNYEIPRWHMDGYFYKSSIPLKKHVVTLIGPPTRILYNQEEAIKVYHRVISESRELDEKERQDYIRKKLAQEFASEPIIDLKCGEQYTLICGGDAATIHSEPHIIGPRVFLSIVNGDKEGLKDQASRWKYEFIE